jgi:hypothetical protein
MRLLLLLMLAGLRLCGQPSWDALRELKAGDRVRILEISGTEHKGAFSSVSNDAITVRTNKGEVAIDRARTRRVQIASNTRRVRNAVIGAAIGVAVGITVDQTLGTYFRNESGQTGAARAVTYVAPIAVLGGIGAALPSWRTLFKN